MLPVVENAYKQVVTKQGLWYAITKMLSPLEYLLFNVNMVFLADGYFEGQTIARAANVMLAPETVSVVQIMTDLQQMILVFFTIKLCLTASSYINFEVQGEEDQHRSSENDCKTHG